VAIDYKNTPSKTPLFKAGDTDGEARKGLPPFSIFGIIESCRGKKPCTFYLGVDDDYNH
jgi:hypothetical protein